MTKLQLTMCAALLAACGSKPTPPANPQPSDQGGSAVAPIEAPPAPETPVVVSEPARPAEPAKPDDTKIKADLLASEMTAYETAKPVFQTYCAKCHLEGGKKASGKKLAHMNMTTYPFGGHHTDSIGNEVRKVLGIDGAKPTMPYDKPGAVKGEDLAKIKAWTDAWLAAGAAGVHPADAAEAD